MISDCILQAELNELFINLTSSNPFTLIKCTIFMKYLLQEKLKANQTTDDYCIL